MYNLTQFEDSLYEIITLLKNIVDIKEIIYFFVKTLHLMQEILTYHSEFQFFFHYASIQPAYHHHHLNCLKFLWPRHLWVTNILSALYTGKNKIIRLFIFRLFPDMLKHFWKTFLIKENNKKWSYQQFDHKLVRLTKSEPRKMWSLGQVNFLEMSWTTIQH